MSIVTPTQEGLKEKAKLLKKFIKERGNVDVSHGHCLDLISQFFGFKDWNTASAQLTSNINQTKPTKTKDKKDIFPIHIKTVGDMKKALELFKDTDTIDADYKFNVKDFLDEIEYANEEIYQEFSMSLESFNQDIVTFKLNLEQESVGYSD